MSETKVMITGIPGNMSSLIATEIVECKDMVLSPVGLTHETFGIIRRGGFALQGIPISGHENAIRKYEPDIIVDFSTGDLSENCKMYCDLGVPFVMGSTGGNIMVMKSIVMESNISAVIAPNMAAPVVLIQSMLEHAAESFSGVFDDYSLKIAESHQEMKTDTSGTAIAVEKLLIKMGAVSDDGGILSIRDPLIQERILGISKKNLKGHGHHEYVLTSRDGTVHLGIIHNIDGRNAYVDGAIEAIRFLAKKSGESEKVFSMTDVLRG